MSVDKRSAVEHWCNAGENLICLRLKHIIGHNKFYPHDRLPAIQALLMEFSPTHLVEYHGGSFKYYDYVYSDGSYIRVYQTRLHTIVLCDFKDIYSNQHPDEFYDKLIELGLIATEVQHVH